MDNAPGHFDAFERDNIRVVFFPPNCTIWKQPCDMGIIVALKKWYKYLYLKDILNFYELDEQLKQGKRELGKRLRRGAAGVSYKNKEYATAMLEDVEELLESMKINEARLDEDSDVNQLEQIVESHDRVEFHGFESLYKQILDIEDQLLCSNVQTEAEEAFDDLKKSFEEF